MMTPSNMPGANNFYQQMPLQGYMPQPMPIARPPQPFTAPYPIQQLPSVYPAPPAGITWVPVPKMQPNVQPAVEPQVTPATTPTVETTKETAAAEKVAEETTPDVTTQELEELKLTLEEKDAEIVKLQDTLTKMEEQGVLNPETMSYEDEIGQKAGQALSQFLKNNPEWVTRLENMFDNLDPEQLANNPESFVNDIKRFAQKSPMFKIARPFLKPFGIVIRLLPPDVQPVARQIWGLIMDKPTNA